MSNWITLSQNSGGSGTTVISVTADTTNNPRSCAYKVATEDEEVFLNTCFVQAARSRFFTVFYSTTGGNTKINNAVYNDNIRGYRVDDGAYVHVPGDMPSTYNFTAGVHKIDYFVVADETDPDNYYVNEYYFQNVAAAIEVIVPNGFQEIRIGAFRGCTNISAVTLGDSIKRIEEFAFCGTNVVNVVCPYLCEEIRMAAFSGCSSLTSITFSDHMLQIDIECCCGCSQLVKVRFPSYLKIIWDDAFSGCRSLEEINLPPSIRFVSDGAFDGCSGATGDIIVPDGDVRLSPYVFRGCSSIENIYLPNTLVTIKNRALGSMSSLTAITIPESVIEIESYAFAGDTGLTSISFPKNVVRLGGRILNGCTNVTEIYSYALIAPVVDSTTFFEISSTGTLHYPLGSDYSTWANRLGSGWICLADL